MKHKFNDFIAGCVCETCAAALEDSAGTLRLRTINRLADDARQQVLALDPGARATPPAAVSEGSADLPANASTAGRIAVGGSVYGTLSPVGDRDCLP